MTIDSDSTTKNEVHFSKRERSKQTAIRLGYIYNLHTTRALKRDWCCKELFISQCPARIPTSRSQPLQQT